MDRRDVGLVGRLALAGEQLQPALERAEGDARVGLARDGRVVDEQELAHRAHAGVLEGDVLGLVDPRRLLGERDDVGDERVRLGLVAVLGEVQRDAALGLRPLAIAAVDAPELAAQPGQVGHRHPVRPRRAPARRRQQGVGVMGVAGGAEEGGILGDEARPVTGAVPDLGLGSLEDVEVVVEAVHAADELQRVDRLRDLLAAPLALRRGLADQDRVRAVAGVGESLPGVLDELAIERRRRVDELLGVARIGTPLRCQPAGLVGLVPDRPVVDPRQPVVGAAVAGADGAHELAELLGVGPEGLLDVGTRRLARRPAWHRRGDVQVHEDPACPRLEDEAVVLLPLLGVVARRVRCLERRLRDLVVGRREAPPEDRHADAVDAECLQLVERRVDLRRGAEQQRVVLEGRLLRPGRERKRGEGRQHEDGGDDRAK